MKVLKGCFLAALATLGIRAQELPAACSAYKPVVERGETIPVSAFVVGEGLRYRWSSESGTIIGEGRVVLWDLTSVPLGEHAITVTAVRPDGAQRQCTVRIFVEGVVTTRGSQMTRRFLLGPLEKESSDYALYSYVLLRPDGGDPAVRERNQKAIEAWFRRIPLVVPLERKEMAGRLNATFVPVKSEPPEDITASWILSNYDYNAADRLLHNLEGRNIRGPCIVSSRSALSRGKLERCSF